MGLKNEQNFVIKISVKNDASTSLQNVSKEAQVASVGSAALQSQMALLTEALRNANETLLALAENYQQASVSMQAVNMATVQVIEGTNQSSAAYKLAAGNMSQLNAATKPTEGTLSSFGGTLMNLHTVMTQTVSNVQSVIHVMNLLTDPQFLDRMQRLANGMALVMAFKGHPQLAQSFRGLANQIEGVGEIVKDFGATEKGVFIDLTTNAINRIESLGFVLETLKGAAETAGMVTLGVGMHKVAMQTSVYSNAVTPAIQSTQQLAGNFVKVDHALTTRLSPALMRLSDIAFMTGPALIGMGAAMQFSEDASVKFIGKLSILAGLLLGGVYAGLSLFLKSIGNVAEAMGDTLLNAMVAFEEKAEKFEQTMAMFTFTIKGFGREIGESAVGGMQKWTDVLGELTDSSKFAMEDIAKGVKSIVAEGASFGLTLDTTEALVRRAIDVASAYGDSVPDTVNKFNAALAGSSQALANMGFNVSDAALHESEYFAAMGRTVEKLTEKEKAVLRADLILHKTRATMGSATNDLTTMAGATQMVEKTWAQLQVQLGLAGTVTKSIQIALATVLRTLLALPQPLIDLTGTLIDFGGIILKVSGIALQYTILLTTMAQLYGWLSVSIGTNIALTNGLNKVFASAAGFLGVNILKVRSFGDAMINLGIITRTVVVSALESFVLALNMLGAGLVRAAVRARAFAITMLTNPMFIKGTAIALSILVVYRALDSFGEKLDEVASILPGWIKVILAAIAAMAALQIAVTYSALAQAALLVVTNKLIIVSGLNTAAVMTQAAAYQVLTGNVLFFAQAALVGLWVKLKIATIAMAKFTWAVMSNPLFWKAAVIVGAIKLILDALSEMRREFSFVDESLQNNGISQASGQLAIFAEGWKSLSHYAGISYTILKELVKLTLSGLITVTLLATRAVYALARAMSGSEEDALAYTLAIEEVDRRLMELGKGSYGNMVTIASQFEATAQAADNAKGAVSVMAASIAHLDKTMAKLSFDEINSLNVQALGTDFERAVDAYVTANATLNRSIEVLRSPEPSHEMIEEETKARIDATKAHLALIRMQKDAVKSLSDAERQASIQTLRDSGKLVEATKLEQAAAVETFEEQISGLQLLSAQTNTVVGDVDKLRAAFTAQGKAAIAAAKGEEQKKASEAFRQKLQDLLRDYESLTSASKQLRNEVMSASMSEASVIDMLRDQQISELTIMAEKLRAKKELSEERNKEIAAMIELISITAEMAKNAKADGARQKLADDAIRRLDAQRDMTRQVNDEFNKGVMSQRELAEIAFERGEADIKATEAALRAAQELTPFREYELKLAREALALRKQLAEEEAPTTVGDVVMGAKAAIDKGGEIFKGFATAWGSGGDSLMTSAGAVLSHAGAGIADGLKAGAQGIVAAFANIKMKDIGAGIIGAFKLGADAVGAVLTGKPLEFMADVLETVQQMPEMLLKMLDRIDKVIGDLLNKFPAMLTKFLDKFPTIIQKLVAALPKIAEGIAAAIPKIVKTIADALPGLIRSLMDQMPKILAAIMDAIVMLIDALPAVFDAIMDKLPAIIETFFEKIPQIFQAIFRAIPTIFESLMDNLPDIILAVVDGIISAIGGIVASFIDEFLMKGGFERMVGSLLRAIPKIIVAIIQGVLRGVTNAIKAMHNVVMGKGFKMPKGLEELPGKIADGAKNLSKQIAKDSSKIFSVKDFADAAKGLDAKAGPAAAAKAVAAEIGKAANAWQKIIDAWRKLWKWVQKIFGGLLGGLEDLWEFVGEIFGDLIDGLQFVWDTVEEFIVKPLVEGLQKVWDFVETKIITPIVEGLQKVWSFVETNIITPIVDGLQKVWNFVETNIITPLTTVVETAFQWVIDNVITPLKNVGTDIVDGVKAQFTVDYWKGHGDKIAEGFKGAASSEYWQGLGGKISEGFKALLPVEQMGTLGSKIWTGFTSALLAGHQKLVDAGMAIVAGLASGLNAGLDWLQAAGSKIAAGLTIALNAAVQFFKDIGGKLWEGMRAAMEGGVQFFKDMGGKLWEGLQASMESGVQFFRDIGGKIWEGLKKGLDTISGGGGGGGFKIPGLALGGTAETASRAYRHAVTYAARGTTVFEPRGTDTSPHMLTPGEEVIRRESAVPNRGLLKAINAAGGPVSLGGGGGGGTNVTIEKIEINSTAPISKDMIKREIVPTMLDEIKRKSRDGVFIMSQAGVRTT